MIAAVAMLGSALTPFAGSKFGGLQEAIADSFSTRAGRLRESLAVEDIWFNSSQPTYVDVSLRNYGSVGLNVTAITLNGTKAWDSGLILLPGKAATIKVSYNWSPGVYFFTVATGRGNTVNDNRATP